MFITILQQAKEQCMKEFHPMDMQFSSDIIVKFFASGMEYRMNYSHEDAEKSFLSCSSPVDFIMGYLQGKGADADMIKEIEELSRCLSNNFSYDIDLVDVFRRGIFHEESILEPHKNHDI